MEYCFLTLEYLRGYWILPNKPQMRNILTNKCVQWEHVFFQNANPIEDEAYGKVTV